MLDVLHTFICEFILTRVESNNTPVEADTIVVNEQHLDQLEEAMLYPHYILSSL